MQKTRYAKKKSIRNINLSVGVMKGYAVRNGIINGGYKTETAAIKDCRFCLFLKHNF